MKIELQRDTVVLEIDQIGRQIFVSEGEASTTKGYFDDAEAMAAFGEMVAARRSEGWEPSKKQQEKLQQAEAKAQKQAALQKRVDDAIAAGNDADAAKDAARTLLRCLAAASRFDELIARVDAVDDEGDLLLTGGGKLTLGLNAMANEPPDSSEGAVWPWFVATRELSCLWLYRDARDVDRNSHNLYFGAEAGPAEPELELERTPFAEARIEWFIEESPWDRFWFFNRSENLAMNLSTLLFTTAEQ